jgi:multidrug efflux system outer membrane protein
MNLRLSPALVAFVLAGCTVTAPYQAPDAKVPDSYSTTFPISADKGAMSDAWWTSFNDAELDALVARALDNNRDIALAMTRLREARAQVRVAEAQERPQVDFGVSGERSRISTNNRIPVRGLPNPANLYQTGFDASWELDLFGRIDLTRLQAVAEAEKAFYDRETIAVSVAAEVAASYIRMRGAQARMATLDEQLLAGRETVKLIAARARSGLVPQVDALRADEVLLGLEAQRPPVAAVVDVEVRRLAVLVGDAPGALVGRFGAGRLPDAMAAVPATAPATLLTRRADLRALERAYAAEHGRVGIAEAERYPTLSLNLAAGLLSLSTGNLATAGSLLWNAGLSSTVPVYRGGSIEGNIDTAAARRDQARLRYEDAAMKAVEEVESAAIRLDRETERHRRTADAVRVSEDIRNLALARFRSGLSDFLSVLDAQRQLFAAQNEETAAREQRMLNVIALHKALGGSWAGSVAKAGADKVSAGITAP